MVDWNEALALIETKLTSALTEIQNLRRQVWALQEENHDLRAQLYCKYHRPDRGKGLASLRDLYQEGYHICPSFFARPLSGSMGCVACLALLASTAEEAE